MAVLNVPLVYPGVLHGCISGLSRDSVVRASRTTWGSVTSSNYGLTPGYMAGTEIVSRTDTELYSYLAGMNGVAYTNAQGEARFTASSRSSGSHRDWTHLCRASNSRVRGALWKALYVQDGKGGLDVNQGLWYTIPSDCLPGTGEVV
jgi:hypothetical protein